MPLPDSILVKISSETAESISLTQVVSQDLPLQDLLALILPTTGKDAARVRQILLRGSAVSGASRFRWLGWDASLEDIALALKAFPDPDPSRAFNAARCRLAVLRGAAARIELPSDAGSKRRLLARRSYWDELMDVVAASALEYAGYSYAERADRYHAALDSSQAARLQSSSTLLSFSTLASRIRQARLDAVELFVPR